MISVLWPCTLGDAFLHCWGDGAVLEDDAPVNSLLICKAGENCLTGESLGLVTCLEGRRRDDDDDEGDESCNNDGIPTGDNSDSDDDGDEGKGLAFCFLFGVPGECS